MLKVLTGGNNTDQTSILAEGDYAFYGEKMTMEDIERASHLPEGYAVGTVTKDDNFWYKVIEV